MLKYNDSGAGPEGRSVETLLQMLAVWSWLIIILIAAGIAGLGSFIHARLKVKDKLKLELAKRDVTVANINLEVQRSQEKQAAMELRSLQISNGLSTSYLPILDDPEPKKKQKELQ